MNMPAAYFNVTGAFSLRSINGLSRFSFGNCNENKFRMFPPSAKVGKAVVPLQ